MKYGVYENMVYPKEYKTTDDFTVVSAHKQVSLGSSDVHEGDY